MIASCAISIPRRYRRVAAITISALLCGTVVVGARAPAFANPTVKLQASPASGPAVPCPATITFSGTYTNGWASDEYRYVRSDGGTGRTHITYVSAGTVPLEPDTWKLGKSYSGWEQVQARKHTVPHGPWVTVSNKANFTLTCAP